MSRRAAVRLSGISYRTGARRLVREIVGGDITIDSACELIEKGVSSVAVLELPLSDAVAECVESALAASGVGPDEIDAVILATESFSTLFDDEVPAGHDAFRVTRDRTFDFFHKLGLRRATVHCASYGGCTNLLQALITAEAMVVRGLSQNVLVVAAEKFGSGRSRLMSEATSLAGDGAAACVVNATTNTGPGVFALKHISAAPYDKYEPDADFARLLLEMFRAMKNAATDCYEACDWRPADFRWLVLGDYNRATSLTYGKLLGFPPERIFLKNVGTSGHIPFDALINLADLTSDGLVGPEDKIFLFLCGPVSCGSAALERT